jgi:hypothetical protein
MSLFLASLLAGVGLIVLAFLLFRFQPQAEKALVYLSRNRSFALVVWALAAVWFLYHIANLGEADFGQYRNLFLLGFGAVAILSWFYLPDLLGLRALGVLGILVGHQFLNAAWMEPPTLRLFLVVAAYGLIVKGLFFGVSPYLLRDGLKWIWQRRPLTMAVSGIWAVYGLVLIMISFTF